MEFYMSQLERILWVTAPLQEQSKIYDFEMLANNEKNASSIENVIKNKLKYYYPKG